MDQNQGLNKATSVTSFKTIVTVYGAIASILLGLLINQAGKLSLWLTAIIVLSVVIWCFLLYKLVNQENSANKKNIEENKTTLSAIHSAIHNAPRPEIFQESIALLDSIDQIIQNISYAKKKNTISIETYEEYIPQILEKICEFTELFSRKDAAKFTANLMFYIDNNPKNEPFLQELLDADEHDDNWIYNKVTAVKFVKFALHSVKFSTATNYQPTTLAICKDGERKEILIPGAADAAINNIAIVNSTDFLDTPNKFKPEVLETAKKYFTSGRGKHIRSIISMRVQRPGLPRQRAEATAKLPILAVINIDGNHPNPLGSTELYYFTYHALLANTLSLIAPAIEDYFLLHPEISKIDNS